MKLALISQRVDVLADRGERRDALDQRLAVFVHAAGFLPVPVPNITDVAQAMFDRLKPQAVILSGGNDLAALGGNAPERDAAEETLVSLAGTHGVPVLGICRGLQFLAQRAGGTLTRLPGHVATRHALLGRESREVNSFHNWAVTALGPGWAARATTADGSIECAGCAAHRQGGIMWHPERELVFNTADLALVREFLAGA